MATGYRGGWSEPLITENLMKDVGVGGQPSLSQCLRLGAMGAHRNLMRDDRQGDGRNFRRSQPVQAARVGRQS